MNTPQEFECLHEDELRALRSALDAATPVPPLSELRRETLHRAAKRATRPRLAPWAGLAAALVFSLFLSRPFLPTPAPSPPAPTVGHTHPAPHPLAQDLLLSELDLLDLHLQDLQSSFFNDLAFFLLEDV